MAIEKMYSVPEAAEVLRVKPYTVWQYLRTGSLRRTKIMGRTVIRESELARVIRDLPVNEPSRRSRQSIGAL